MQIALLPVVTVFHHSESHPAFVGNCQPPRSSKPTWLDFRVPVRLTLKHPERRRGAAILRSRGQRSVAGLSSRTGPSADKPRWIPTKAKGLECFSAVQKVFFCVSQDLPAHHAPARPTAASRTRPWHAGGIGDRYRFFPSRRSVRVRDLTDATSHRIAGRIASHRMPDQP
jgi:hypothetical protein